MTCKAKKASCTARCLRLMWNLMIFCLIAGCSGDGPACPDPGISAADLKDTVQHLAAIDPPRSYDNEASMNKAAAYIAKQFLRHGLKPERQSFAAGGRTYANVIASVGPATGRRLIVGAHYDVSGDQPGADDNASAVAGLIEIARYAKKHESRLRHRIDFVAYALEEPPFFGTGQMGSYIHARSLKEKNVDVIGMISLECIGYFSDEKGSQSFPVPGMGMLYPTQGNFITVVGNFASLPFSSRLARALKTTGVDVKTLNAPSFVTGVNFSDHRNYWHFGYNAVMVTDTAFFRNPHYHETTDTPDTLDYEKMREVVTGICRAVLSLT